MDATEVAPLTPDEDTAWRALTFVANHLVKTLGEDLTDETSLSLSEYVVLVHLSEATDQKLRIGDVAEAVGLSPSRMSRLIDQMTNAGLVIKIHLEGDARCMFAEITGAGLAALKAAYPMQLRNVRRRVFDHLSANEVKVLGRALEKVRSALD